MTRAELRRRALATERVHAALVRLSPHAIQMVAEVAESLAEGEVRVEEERRVREEVTRVH